MNERIFELAKQADLIQWDTLSSGARTPDHASVVKARKFAEKIVRECARVYWNIDDGEIHGEYVNALKEHFGVEE
jgi:hypothetical protein